MKNQPCAYTPVGLPLRHSKAGDPALFSLVAIYPIYYMIGPPSSSARTGCKPVRAASSIHAPEHHRCPEQGQHSALVREPGSYHASLIVSTIVQPWQLMPGCSRTRAECCPLFRLGDVLEP